MTNRNKNHHSKNNIAAAAATGAASASHYGKAHSGQVFKDDLVTYDMVQSLLNPFIKKSFFDYLIIVSLAINVAGFYYLYSNPQLNHWIIPTFVTGYFFWRISYNLGIGILLYNQSNYNSMTDFATNHQLFNYSSDTKPRTRIQNFIEMNFQIKYGDKFKITNYPIDFNTWLLFRNFVDLILMQDFMNYFILFIACLVQNSAYSMGSEQPILFYSRWTFGILFILLNFVVKLDAHHVIKDFAWYWGDFFYLKINNEELVFDGIFELFPHPMYSIGYIGYYGFALLSRSHLVLAVSCIAHLCQFLFLHYVEDPHIHKTYGGAAQVGDLLTIDDYDIKLKPMFFFNNFCWLRPADYLIVIVNLVGLFFGITYKSQDPNFNLVLFIINLGLKVGFTALTSGMLYFQSTKKSFTKRYLKYDLNFIDAFNNWCVYYNFQLLININVLVSLFIREFISTNNLYSMSWSSFIALHQKDSLFLFRLFIGTFMLLLNFLCESSILESIGIYSWFYGDFFLPNWKDKKLTRTGVYKYLNNPENILGICGVWGLSIICFNSHYLFILAMVWSLCKILFIKFVETPHMVKLYGESQVNYDSGFRKTFKKIIPKKIRDRASFSKPSRPEILKSSSSSSSSVAAEKQFDGISFETPNPFITISKTDPDYQIELLNVAVEPCTTINSQSKKNKTKLSIALGNPIKFYYRIPKKHNKFNWVGLYRVVNTFNDSTTTLITSKNHWVAIDPTAYDNRYLGHEHIKENRQVYKSKFVFKDSQFEEGVLEFNNQLQYWEPGVYELRYHYSDGHDVALISQAFEMKFLKVELPDDSNDEEAVMKFQRSLFDMLVNTHGLLKFEFVDGHGKLQQFKVGSMQDDFVSIIIEYLNAYSGEILASDDLKKNLNLKHLNSYNVEEYKKKQLFKILKRLSYVIKNSIGNNNADGDEDDELGSTIDIEFSREILIQEKTLKNLFDRIIKVQKILDEIAN
ncbi:phosphatidylethanolamine N-methyltransferase [Saccharomycopsis crataegensis]|uniref:Phosphatidylethanolamine N-methyltransferase n=1 Tax=Saccharomycopsis crataegensis TaxID=43959 RepID=A0AAV5QLR2_9ASCO|nr:phosphatidylethanolamine N-methyltransferase [Saccharomycopsis crataegensis]